MLDFLLKKYGFLKRANASLGICIAADGGLIKTISNAKVVIKLHESSILHQKS